MKKFFCFVSCIFLFFNVYSNTTSSQAANRKTALRYLQLAKNYLAQDDWASVKKSCEYGLQYDADVSDLYYLNALSMFNLSEPRYAIIPVIEKSITTAQWVDYNMTNARVFYADLLCSTGKPQKAMEVIDSAPLIYSSDAEYVRIKSLYELNTEQSIAKAEEKIDSARRVYPNDVRFFYLFFNYEYNLVYVENESKTGFEKKALSPYARKIADSFIAHVPDYDKFYTDLEILAASFAEGENQKRLLKAFNARGFKHILYPVIALDAGVITEEEALDYFLTFINDKIEAKLLMQFYTMIKDENLKKYFDDNLNAFAGTLIYDTNNTLEENLTVKYERGRAQKIIFDCDNDQSLEWEVDCDFGEPKKTVVYDEGALVVYGTYPNVSSIIFEDVEPGVKGSTVFNIIDETFQSKTFEIVKAPEIDSTDFFVIDETSLSYGKDLFDSDKISECANIMDKPSLERPGARIRFSVLNGVPYKAVYYVDNNEYAHAQFLDSQKECVIRNVDMNSDGIFETTEYYSVLNGTVKVSPEENDAITTNIWGSPVENASVYLSAIAIDNNLDTFPDFIEAYLEDGTSIASWDSDYDGQKDIVYTKYPEWKDGITHEDQAYLINDPVKGRIWIHVIVDNNIPVYVIEDEQSTEVLPGKNKNFYWIGKQESAGYEMNIMGQVSQYEMGQMFQMEEADCYIHVVKVGQNIFARKIVKDKASENSLAGDNPQNE